MAKNLNPKCKQCRRAGEKLMLRGERCSLPKCAMIKKNYPPGMHKSQKRQSDYGLQLAEKQKIKRQYNILEKQFRLIFQKAQQQAGNTGDNLLKLLELRLDNVIYRLGLATSRSQARQLVNHGHFTINGRKIDIPSYQTKENDLIQIKKKAKENKLLKKIILSKNKNNIPGWLYFDAKELTGKVLHKPSIKDIPININTQMIVEYYSR